MAGNHVAGSGPAEVLSVPGSWPCEVRPSCDSPARCLPRRTGGRAAPPAGPASRHTAGLPPAAAGGAPPWLSQGDRVMTGPASQRPRICGRDAARPRPRQELARNRQRSHSAQVLHKATVVVCHNGKIPAPAEPQPRRVLVTHCQLRAAGAEAGPYRQCQHCKYCHRQVLSMTTLRRLGAWTCLSPWLPPRYRPFPVPE
jgi:hypothetical protein